MYKLSGGILLVIIASLTFLGSNRQEPAAPGSPDLPSGPMQDKARNACTTCHDSGIIAQQRLSKEAWTKEVDKMIRWGTQLDPNDRERLIDYLSTSFPTDKPADRQLRTAKAK
jgi:hypothetical protein